MICINCLNYFHFRLCRSKIMLLHNLRIAQQANLSLTLPCLALTLILAINLGESCQILIKSWGYISNNLYVKFISCHKMASSGTSNVFSVCSVLCVCVIYHKMPPSRYISANSNQIFMKLCVGHFCAFQNCVQGSNYPNVWHVGKEIWKENLRLSLAGKCVKTPCQMWYC